jgi:hypothetical protein
MIVKNSVLFEGKKHFLSCYFLSGIWIYADDRDNQGKQYLENITTVKPADVVTSIKQSPVLKGHLFLVLS